MRLRMLSQEQLEKLNTKRLLGVLRVARAVESAEQLRLRMPHVCCEVCMEWMLDAEDWEEKIVKPTAHLTSNEREC
jgi:hypothetical protein